MGKYCSKCGTELQEGAKFCKKCGAAVVGVQKAASSTRTVEKRNKHKKKSYPIQIRIR